MNTGKEKSCILVLVSRFPFPLEKGDKLRAYYQIRELSQAHEIILFSLSDQPVSQEQIAELKPFCKDIYVNQLSKPRIALNLMRSFFDGMPYQVGYFYTAAINRKLDEIIEKHRPQSCFAQLIRTSQYVRHRKNLRKTLDYMDVFSKGMSRRIEKEAIPKKWAVQSEYNRLMKYEREIFEDFDERIIISAQDRDLIPHPENEKIKVIPNGVDYEYFRPMEMEKRFDLLFAGNMGYPPNIESVNFIVRQVMPEVWKTRPETNLVIAGATPAPEVRALAGDRVEVTGWVEDIREYFAASRIMLAPMLISIGMQNKILQAMAMKIPCVVTTLANNAIGAPVGQALREANSPEEYARDILDLLEFPEKARELAENASNFVHSTYDWAVTGRELTRLITGKNA